MAAAIGAIAALAACASGPIADTTPEIRTSTAEQRNFEVEGYVLGVGDRIRIDVFGEADLSLDTTLDASGVINYPLLGRIQAVGKTAKAVENDITRKLKSGYLVDPNVRAQVIQFRPVYVTGEVGRPGAYPYSSGLTVSRAITLAGGMSRLASERRIYVQRENAAQNARRRAALDTAVLPGDTIVVEEGLF